MIELSRILAKRPFGRTGLMVSPLTFGAWSIGGPAEMGGKQIGWVGVNDDDSIDALKVAYDAGVNLFDTADAYGRGHSERLLGRAFCAGGVRDKVLISSKAGMVDNPDGFKLDFSRAHLMASCEGSLKRLGTDYLDIYLLHMVTDGYPLTEDIRDTLADLKRAGKIRHYGVSVQFPQQGMEQLDRHFGDAMMIEYSPLKRAGVEDVLVRAHNLGVGVITRGALEKGLLSGKYEPGHRFDARDVRSRIPGEQIDRVLAGVAELRSQATREGWSLLGMALQFQLAHAGCSTVTVGMKTRQQVEENVAAIGERHAYDFERMIATLEGAVRA
jgi:aryl-alcohol dehydrogenase-like predicted oxidoreductase